MWIRQFGLKDRCESRELNAGFFVPGRMAMTCCADDTQFIGYICKNPAAKRLRIGSWVTVTAKVKDEFMGSIQRQRSGIVRNRD